MLLPSNRNGHEDTCVWGLVTISTLAGYAVGLSMGKVLVHIY